MDMGFLGFLGPFDELEKQGFVFRIACMHTGETSCVSLGAVFQIYLFPTSVCSASSPASGHDLVHMLGML